MLKISEGGDNQPASGEEEAGAPAEVAGADLMAGGVAGSAQASKAIGGAAAAATPSMVGLQPKERAKTMETEARAAPRETPVV